jgi:hypothetical protein
VIRFSIPSLLQAGFKISPEMVNTGKYAHDGEFSKRAEAFILHLAGDSLQQVNILVDGFTRFNPIRDVTHPVGAVSYTHLTLPTN